MMLSPYQAAMGPTTAALDYCLNRNGTPVVECFDVSRAIHAEDYTAEIVRVALQADESSLIAKALADLTASV